MGREFELKYTASPEKLREIRQLWENWETISMATTYFDTASGLLSSQNCTLRTRLENGISVCTLKTPTQGYGRGEWDKAGPWCAETVEELFQKAERTPVAFDDLQEVCGARFTRLAKTVELPGCTVEISLDEGVLMVGGRETPLCEMEVEVKSGDEKAAVIFAKYLAERFALCEETKSKFCRAALLAKGE